MPNIKSAKKRVKLTKKQNQRNTSFKSSLKTAIKKFLAAIETKADNAETLYNEVCCMIDKAAGKNIMHKNAAARKKSRLAKLYN